VWAIRFIVPDRSLSLWNAREGHWGRAQPLGRRTLREGFLTLDLHRTRIVTRGRRTIALDLSLHLATAAPPGRYAIEAAADDRLHGSQQQRLRRSLVLERRT
jgi:hypothetical protein